MQTERITSAQNPLIRHIRRLQTSRPYRQEQGEFLCDGRKLLAEALRWYPRISTVVHTPDFVCPPLPPQTRVVEIPESLMESLSSMKTPQGVLFICRLPQELPPELHPGMLLLDRIQDPGNLGTILRTADALGVSVVLTNGCADPYAEKTVRASMGAVFRTLPQQMELPALLRRCAAQGLALAATALSPDAVDLREAALGDYLVVIGSEGQGICPELLEAAQKKLIIPMQPRCESLNAGVAAAIVMWQMINSKG